MFHHNVHSRRRTRHPGVSNARLSSPETVLNAKQSHGPDHKSSVNTNIWIFSMTRDALTHPRCFHLSSYNVLTGEFVDPVLDPMYFGGKCEYVYNGEWRKFIYDSFCENLQYRDDEKNYRKPYNYHTYRFVVGKARIPISRHEQTLQP